MRAAHRDALTAELGESAYAWLYAEDRFGTPFVLEGGPAFSDQLRQIEHERPRALTDASAR